MKIINLLIIVLSLGLFSCNQENTDGSDKIENKLSGALAELPENVGIKIQGVKDGTTVSSPLKLSVALKIPEGSELDNGSVFILVRRSFMKKGTVIPEGKDGIIKLSNYQKEFEIEVKPGKQVITAQYVDSNNRSYGYDLSHSIKVIVE